MENFNEEEINKIKGVIKEIVSAGSFALPDSSLPTVVMHDASGIGYGYIAMQEREGLPHIIDMDSRNFPRRKKEIATLDRELTGMLFAMVKLGYLVPLSKMTFYTDHQALLGLIRKFDGGLIHGKRAQAIMMLRSAGAAFRYVPGVQMMYADAISRWKEGSLEEVLRKELINADLGVKAVAVWGCLLYTSPSPRDATLSRMPSSA